eukprot:COSAG06_NODE_61166_length_268_cov_1.100592_1_plen_63_part_01
MFVPSLSWQKYAFCIEMAQKWRFFTEVSQRRRHSDLQKTPPLVSQLFLSSSRACLGKLIMFSI